MTTEQVICIFIIVERCGEGIAFFESYVLKGETTLKLLLRMGSDYEKQRWAKPVCLMLICSSLGQGP